MWQKAGQQEPWQSRVTAPIETGQEKTSELHLYVESKSKTDKQNKPNADTENTLVISRDHRVDGWVKWVMGINYMVMEHRRLKTMKFFFFA